MNPDPFIPMVLFVGLVRCFLVMPWPGSCSQRGVDLAVRISLVHLVFMIYATELPTALESQTWCLKQSQLQHL